MRLKMRLRMRLGMRLGGWFAVAAAGLCLAALPALGAHHEMDDACMEACEQAQLQCLEACEGASDEDTCVTTCEDQAEACGDACVPE